MRFLGDLWTLFSLSIAKVLNKLAGVCVCVCVEGSFKICGICQREREDFNYAVFAEAAATTPQGAQLCDD